jgi:hypothetical protein
MSTPTATPPLSRNDTHHTLTLHIPHGSPLWTFLTEEQCPHTETPQDAILRLLEERRQLSQQGF